MDKSQVEELNLGRNKKKEGLVNDASPPVLELGQADQGGKQSIS